MEIQKSYDVRLVKASEEYNLLYGYAVTSTKRSTTGAYEDVVDLQNDVVTFKAVMKSAIRASKSSLPSLTNHAGEPSGRVAFMMPMDQPTAKALGLGDAPEYEGLLVAIETNDAMIAAYKRNEIGGLSIGGSINA